MGGFSIDDFGFWIWTPCLVRSCTVRIGNLRDLVGSALRTGRDGPQCGPYRFRTDPPEIHYAPGEMNGVLTTVALRIAPSAGTWTTVPSVKNGFLSSPRQIAAFDRIGETVLLVTPPTWLPWSS